MRRGRDGQQFTKTFVQARKSRSYKWFKPRPPLLNDLSSVEKIQIPASPTMTPGRCLSTSTDGVHSQREGDPHKDHDQRRSARDNKEIFPAQGSKSRGEDCLVRSGGRR